MTPSPYSYPTFLVCRTLSLVALLALPLSARDDIFGTPDADGDLDGDPVGDGYVFSVDSAITDGAGDPFYNRMVFQSDGTPTEYWVTSENGANSQWNNYAVEGTTEQYMAARVTEELNAGDTYYYRQSAELGFEQYTMAWEVATDVLPLGTKVSFGFGMSGSPMEIDAAGTLAAGGTLDPIAPSGNDPVADGAAHGTTTAPSGYDGLLGDYLWYNYETNASMVGAEFTIKTPTFQGTSSEVGDIIFFFEFPATLQTGETMPTYTDWALSGYNDKGEFVSVAPGTDYYLTEADGLAKTNVQNDDPLNDLVFGWTVDNKTSTWGESNTNALPVPEPTLPLMPALTMLVLVSRRSRR